MGVISWTVGTGTVGVISSTAGQALWVLAPHWEALWVLLAPQWDRQWDRHCGCC